MNKVLIVSEKLAHYRIPFLVLLEKELRDRNISLEYIHGDDYLGNIKSIEASWSHKVINKTFLRGKLVYQPILGRIKKNNYDLVIFSHANKYVLVFILLFFKNMLSIKSKIALWGHGINLQSGNFISNALKGMQISLADYYFGYTELTKRIINTRFKKHINKVKVVNNTIDTGSIKGNFPSVKEMASIKDKYGISSNNVGVFVGNIYDLKRVDFLLDSALKIRKSISDFELIIIGDGEGFDDLKSKYVKHTFIRFTGALYGKEKVHLASCAKVLLMPGLIGLVIIDAFALGLPVITTDVPYHSPEVEYLIDRENGLMIKESNSVDAYAKAVSDLLKNETLLNNMSENCKRMAEELTLESMVDNFADGVEEVLRG